MNYPMNTIEDALEDIKNGKIIIVVDDEDRENEGNSWQGFNLYSSH